MTEITFDGMKVRELRFSALGEGFTMATFILENGAKIQKGYWKDEI